MPIHLMQSQGMVRNHSLLFDLEAEPEVQANQGSNSLHRQSAASAMDRTWSVGNTQLLGSLDGPLLRLCSGNGSEMEKKVGGWSRTPAVLLSSVCHHHGLPCPSTLFMCLSCRSTNACGNGNALLAAPAIALLGIQAMTQPAPRHQLWKTWLPFCNVGPTLCVHVAATPAL
jgi:hypothetical protein